MSIENIVEVSGKEIKIIDAGELVKVLENLKTGVAQTASLGEIFKNYIHKFQGRANLGETARIINRDLENARKGDIKELARKLDLTTITGAQQTRADSAANIQSQAKITTAELANPPNTEKQQVPPTTVGLASIKDYAAGNALKRRMAQEGL